MCTCRSLRRRPGAGRIKNSIWRIDINPSTAKPGTERISCQMITTKIFKEMNYACFFKAFNLILFMKKKLPLIFILTLTLLCSGFVQSQNGGSPEVKKNNEVNVFD